MANNPKIKIDADLSSFEAELEKLKQSLGQMGDMLKTSSGKAQFNMGGSAKELGELLRQTEKLTSLLDRGGKTSAQYAKNLKEAKEAMEQAAKVASRLEDAGTARTNKVSRYFRGYADDLAGEHSSAIRQAQVEREMAARDAARQANNSRWAGHAARFVGFAGGAMLGGGGVYSRMGSFAGSMLPGPFGMVGGAVGGMLGGAADRFISPARTEAQSYSELRRALGSTTTDFDHLRGAVRAAVDGLGIADTEAANLARQFAKTAGLTGNQGDAIARGINTGSGFARGYGIDPAAATQFLATMRSLGGANNDKDNRRLAMLIGESVTRGGTSGKMDEVLSAISGFAAHSTSQMLLAPNVGQYSSYLASLTGSNYAGLKGNVGGAAQLLNIGESGVQSGGTMGEASQLHWLMARQRAFKGMSALDNSLMQTAGLTGDLGSLFAPGSAAYDRAKSTGDMETVGRMDSLRKQIQGSGFRNNFQVAMAHIKAISGGDAYQENANFRGMFGGNSQQAAALMQMLSNDPGLGRFEKQLGKYDINVDNVNPTQIASLSALMGGGDKAMVAQYEKLLGSGKLSAGEVNRAEGIMSKEGYGDNLKKLLLELTAKYDTDVGMESQKTQIELSNEISRGVSNLVGIENDVRNLLMSFIRSLPFGNSSAVNSIDSRDAEFAKAGIPGSGMSIKGKPINPSAMIGVNDALARMGRATSQTEKAAIADEYRSSIDYKYGRAPAETDKWLAAALAGGGKSVSLSADTSRPTISGVVPSSRLSQRQKDIVGMVRGNSTYDSMFQKIGAELGLDPLIIEQLAAQESGLNPNRTHRNANGTTDLGLMQHNSRYAGSRGLLNWRDPYANAYAGGKFFKQLLDQSGGDIRTAFRRYNGSGSAAESYADMAMGSYNALHENPMPGFAMNGAGVSKTSFQHDIKVTLLDHKGSVIPTAVAASAVGAPRAAGS